MTWVTMYIFVCLIVCLVVLHLCNIIIAVKGIQLLSPKEPCPGYNNLRIFLIGIVIHSTVTLLQYLSICRSDNSDSNKINATSLSRLVVIFGLIWVIHGRHICWYDTRLHSLYNVVLPLSASNKSTIIGSVWLFNASACRASGEAIVLIATQYVAIHLVSWIIEVYFILLNSLLVTRHNDSMIWIRIQSSIWKMQINIIIC